MDSIGLVDLKVRSKLGLRPSRITGRLLEALAGCSSIPGDLLPAFTNFRVPPDHYAKVPLAYSGSGDRSIPWVQ